MKQIYSSKREKADEKKQILTRACMDAKFLKRFWAKIDKTGGCWIWTGTHVGGGYGGIRIGYKHQGEYRALSFLAHRVMWTIAYGAIPDGLNVLHRCDNPPCVNPEHLFVGTQSDNANDSVSKGRWLHPRGEKHSSAKLTEAQVLEIRASKFPKAKLARIYGVSRWQIDSILSRYTWKHI